MIPADEMYLDDPRPELPSPLDAVLDDEQPTVEGTVRLDSIEAAIEAIRLGKAIIVVDDEDRENEGDLIFAASAATPALTAFMIRYTSGYICVGMDGELLDHLGLPPMTQYDQLATPMYNIFTTTPTMTPYRREEARVDLLAKNGSSGEGALRSSRMDWSEYDLVDFDELNDILWRSFRGGQPMPAPVRSALLGP